MNFICGQNADIGVKCKYVLLSIYLFEFEFNKIGIVHMSHDNHS